MNYSVVSADKGTKDSSRSNNSSKIIIPRLFQHIDKKSLGKRIPHMRPMLALIITITEDHSLREKEMVKVVAQDRKSRK